MGSLLLLLSIACLCPLILDQICLKTILNLSITKLNMYMEKLLGR
jgi:hypothetical protein